ncbi:TPA: hypothetical protein NJT28_001811 [Corynebacterium striatum]|nr:hypothetical protein [Corynebacterium striatum]HCG2963131.1 hypothetical protein [Corynebacterium striatum]
MQAQTTQMPSLTPERIAQERDFDTVFLGILSGVLLVYVALMAAALV